MKRIFLLLFTALLLLPVGLFGGSLDYLTNQSARWLMTPTRNAATDAADIVNYNPAGTVFLPLGWNIDISNQTLFKWYGNDTTLTPGGGGPFLTGSDKSLKQDLPTWYLPNIYFAYNLGRTGPGKLALYGQLGITAGGGNLKYEDGTAGTTFALNGLRAAIMGGRFAPGLPIGMDIGAITSQSFEASSVYYGIAVGGAYSLLDDMASVSLGGRLLMPRRSFSLESSFANDKSFSAEFEYNAYGFTPIIGFDVKPTDGLTLAFRYEFETALKFEYEEKSVNDSYGGGITRAFLTSQGLTDGKKFNQNLPHSFFLGAEYDVTNDFTVSLAGNIYLLSSASMNGTEDYFGTGYEIGLGATYKIVKDVKLGFGVFYTETGAKDSYFNSSSTALNASGNPTLDSIAFGLGGTYSFTSGFDATLSFLYCHYLPVDYSITAYNTNNQPIYTVDGTYKKDVLEIGIGVGYKY
ncbi:MAG: hypothetical protein LBQ57_10795 [Spirochaetales bacterium]|jgi:long-chain fatty acid transport protein|nr:hypothetical protein [Spirochaetales bacterium]